MLKVYQREEQNDIVTVVVTSKFKEVTVTSPNLGSNSYRADLNDNRYGSMGSYVNSWLRAVEGLQPVVVMD